MSIKIPAEDKEYEKWKLSLESMKTASEYLMLPVSHSFNKQGFCSSLGNVNVPFSIARSFTRYIRLFWSMKFSPENSSVLDFRRTSCGFCCTRCQLPKSKWREYLGPKLVMSSRRIFFSTKMGKLKSRVWSPGRVKSRIIPKPLNSNNLTLRLKRSKS